MTVNDLIEQLKELNKDARIIIDDENDNLQLYTGHKNNDDECVTLKFFKAFPYNDGDKVSEIANELKEDMEDDALSVYLDKAINILGNIVIKYNNRPVKIITKSIFKDTGDRGYATFNCFIRNVNITNKKYIDFELERITHDSYKYEALNNDSSCAFYYDFSNFKIIPLSDEEYAKLL